ncbi:MAG: hypothetical protein ABSF13_08215 [Smithella sp.]|jgi:signal peptidase I
MKAETNLPFLHRFPSSFVRQSLVRASLDIGRVLAERDGVTFTAQGTCMYPTVRPRDVLTIKPRPAADIVVGDIAVCRAPDYLFSHRVIDKGEHEGRTYIITRPDRSRYGNDGKTFDENLLGVVVAIKRNGKKVPLVPTHYPRLVRYYYKKRFVLIEAKECLKLRLAELLVHTDTSVFYRLTVRTWFMLTRPCLTYVVQIPLNATLGDTVSRRLEPDAFDPETAVDGRKIMRWTITAHLNGGRKPAAWVAFARDEADTWRVAESHVRLRYRGAGLEEALWQKAEKIFATGSRSCNEDQSGIHASSPRRKN